MEQEGWEGAHGWFCLSPLHEGMFLEYPVWARTAPAVASAAPAAAARLMTVEHESLTRTCNSQFWDKILHK